MNLLILSSLFLLTGCEVILNVTKDNHDKLMKKVPLLCPENQEIARIRINHNYHCNNFLNKSSDKIDVNVLLYRPNVFNHDTDAVVCKRVYTQLGLRCIDWWADLNENYDTTWTEPVPYHECISLNATKYSQKEKANLVGGFGGIFQTNFQPTIPDPSCFHHKTVYYTPPVSNVYIIPTKVSRNLHGHMISPSGSMAICQKFSDGYCERLDNTTIIWQKPDHWEDKLIPYNILDAYMTQDVIVSTTGGMGLTNWTSHDNGYHYAGEVSPNGNTWEKRPEIPEGTYKVFKSIQGILFSIVPKIKGDKSIYQSLKEKVPVLNNDAHNRTEENCKKFYGGAKINHVHVIDSWFVSDLIPSHQALSVHRCFELLKMKAVEYFRTALTNLPANNEPLRLCLSNFYKNLLVLVESMNIPEDKLNVNLNCLEMGSLYKENLLNLVRGFQIGDVLGRKKREVDTTHVADTAETTATIQFALLSMMDDVEDGKRKIAHHMCMFVQQTSSHLTAIIDTPRSATKYARSILGINNIAARAYGSYLIVTACAPIWDYHFLPMGGACSLNVPLNYSTGAKVSTTHMDPDTRICTSNRRPVPCHSVPHLVVDFDPPFVISTATGAKTELKFNDFHIFDKFEDILPNGLIPIPEMGGIDIREFEPSYDTFEEAAEFASNLRKGLAQITGKPGPGQHNDFNPEKFIDGLWHWSFFSLIAPSFEDSPFLRLWIILVCLEITIKFILQYILPPIFTYYFVNYVGVGKAIANFGPAARKRKRRAERDGKNQETIEMI